MMIALHKCARTTPAVRAEIAVSLPVAVLARRYNVSESTIRKWRARTDFHDRPHTAKRLQTRMTPEQEVIAVELRRSLLLPLDDLLAVVREFICPDVSRLRSCALPAPTRGGQFACAQARSREACPSADQVLYTGLDDIDVKYLPQMADEKQRQYLFVAIERASRWAFVQVKPNKTAAAARDFLKALHKACPVNIHNAYRQRQGVHRG